MEVIPHFYQEMWSTQSLSKYGTTCVYHDVVIVSERVGTFFWVYMCINSKLTVK